MVDRDYLESMLESFKHDEISMDEVLKVLKALPFEDLGYARVDHHRSLRKGYPEVVYCQGKTVDQIVGIVEALAAGKENLLLTRAGPEVREAVAAKGFEVEYDPLARTAIIWQKEEQPGSGFILIVSAGTSDIPVAREAALTARALGNRVECLFDVGVAGVHRLLAGKALLDQARVIIAVAGMDGVLPSVVGGLVNKPVIAVPTSVGYGASFGGVAALLTMLNCCASGVAVVNIDNGFGAAYMASLINQQGESRALKSCEVEDE